VVRFITSGQAALKEGGQYNMVERHCAGQQIRKPGHHMTYKQRPKSLKEKRVARHIQSRQSNKILISKRVFLSP
jgi:hypothetical protein